MPLIANTRFERYNRGDTIREKDEPRFRGTYPHSVVEVSEEDMQALDEMAAKGQVQKWVDDICARPSLKEQQDAEVAAKAEADAKAAAEAAKAQAAPAKPATSAETTAAARRSGGPGRSSGARRGADKASEEPVAAKTADEPGGDD